MSKKTFQFIFYYYDKTRFVPFLPRFLVDRLDLDFLREDLFFFGVVFLAIDFVLNAYLGRLGVRNASI